MSQHGAELSSDDVMKLLLKYDLKNNDTFCYTDFLRHFVLSQPRREKTESLLHREKTMPARISVSAAPRESLAGTYQRKCCTAGKPRLHVSA